MFNNQHVVVTGGTRGIGAAITRYFLEHGARVVALYQQNHEKAQMFQSTLPATLQERLTLKSCDIGQVGECQAFWHWYSEHFPTLEILINNGGIKRDQIAAIMKIEDWNDVINTNLNGTFYMSQEAIKLMLANRYGRIINMGSVSGRIALPGQSNYSASKAAQSALTRVLAKEVGKKGITVNCVCPGFVDTEMLQDMGAELETYKKEIPLRRFARADEVAHAVGFLAGKDAAYITGIDLVIDGGMTA